MIARSTTRAARRAGNALVLALLVVTTVAALGAGFMHITSSLATRQSVGIDSLRAFYIAEAGLSESFQAVRMGRTGALGSIAEPAHFGDGLVWVTATDTVDGQIRLESTALCGTGRASLALVIEPVQEALGFFSDEDLVVDSVVLFDGYDSSVAPYSGSALDPGPTAEELRVYADGLHKAIGTWYFGKVVLGPDIDPNGDYIGGLGEMTVAQLTELAQWQPALRLGYPMGYTKRGPVPSYPPPADAEGEDSAPRSALGVTTGKFGLLSSNGDVQFALDDDEAAEIWGDVIPGPGGAVTGRTRVTISGSTHPRAAEVELPMVEVPEIELAPAIRHDDLLPLLLASGTSGYEGVVVGAGAELVLRGPLTAVIGELVLEPGAALSFDTRAGDVALYVVRSLDLQPGSLVSTSGEVPEQTTVQVAATSDDPLDPAVKLDATAQFHGTLYAPDSNVRIGSSFEFYGGVVSRRLSFGAGARLHFDNHVTEGSPIPRILSWRVIQIPSEVRTVFGDPFRTLGVERDALVALSEAHDLARVQLDVIYEDAGGVTHTWSGTEDEFDWSQVSSLEAVTRSATRKKEAPAPDAPESGPDAVEDADDSSLLDLERLLRCIRTDVVDALVDYEPCEDKLDKIYSLAPYSAEEWEYILAHEPKVTDAELLRLQQADLEARSR